MPDYIRNSAAKIGSDALLSRDYPALDVGRWSAAYFWFGHGVAEYNALRRSIDV